MASACRVPVLALCRVRVPAQVETRIVAELGLNATRETASCGAGSTVTENCTYIQNPSFPAPLTTAGTSSYNVRKINPGARSKSAWTRNLNT